MAKKAAKPATRAKNSAGRRPTKSKSKSKPKPKPKPKPKGKATARATKSKNKSWSGGGGVPFTTIHFTPTTTTPKVYIKLNTGTPFPLQGPSPNRTDLNVTTFGVSASASGPFVSITADDNSAYTDATVVVNDVTFGRINFTPTAKVTVAYCDLNAALNSFTVRGNTSRSDRNITSFDAEASYDLYSGNVINAQSGYAFTQATVNVSSDGSTLAAPTGTAVSCVGTPTGNQQPIPPTY
jgi:hypothetical protein